MIEFSVFLPLVISPFRVNAIAWGRNEAATSKQLPMNEQKRRNCVYTNESKCVRRRHDQSSSSSSRFSRRQSFERVASRQYDIVASLKRWYEPAIPPHVIGSCKLVLVGKQKDVSDC